MLFNKRERGVWVTRWVGSLRVKLSVLQAYCSWAKGFQKLKINVNLRQPGHLNRIIMQLYIYLHSQWTQSEVKTYTCTNTYTHCPGIRCTAGKCFVFCWQDEAAGSNKIRKGILKKTERKRGIQQKKSNHRGDIWCSSI